MKRNHINNFIIFIGLMVTLLSIAGTGLSQSRMMDSRLHTEDIMKEYVASELVSPDSVCNIQIVKAGCVLISSFQMRVVRSIFHYESSLYFLCTLIFLSGLFLFSNREKWFFYGNRFVSYICYHVDYIELQDGCK